VGCVVLPSSRKRRTTTSSQRRLLSVFPTTNTKHHLKDLRKSSTSTNSSMFLSSNFQPTYSVHVFFCLRKKSFECGVLPLSFPFISTSCVLHTRYLRRWRRADDCRLHHGIEDNQTRALVSINSRCILTFILGATTATA
jgi:hypothetical protein